jgi:hypothetical protein
MDEESYDKKLWIGIRGVEDNYKNPDFSEGDFVKAMGMSKSLLNNN